jgi:hypothetical protein
MSDAYCKKHLITYCHELSKDCPYCRITELEARLEAVKPLPDKWRVEWHLITHPYAAVKGKLECADELNKALEVSNG